MSRNTNFDFDFGDFEETEQPAQTPKAQQKQKFDFSNFEQPQAQPQARKEDKTDLVERLGTIAPFVLLAGALVLGLGALKGLTLPSGSKSQIDSPDHKIAIAVGHAEGTRTCDGGKTKAYETHRDPGDRKVNGGTFSAAPRGNGITAGMSPEERDRSFLQNINSALAATDTSGMSPLELATFVDLKVQAHPDVSQQFAKSAGDDSEIVERRVQAYFFNGKNKSWTSEPRLRQDQQRRHDRISECLA